MNEMAVPEHTALGEEAAMLTEGVVDGLIEIVNPLLVAFAFEIQEAFDVNTQVTTWPFVTEAVVKLAAFAPVTFDPLIRHW